MVSHDSCPRETNQAGKAAACAGCPSQSICASTKKPVDDSKEVAASIEHVKRRILVLSGKGGVGKSTVASILSWALSEKMNVGLVDVDVCGPSIPQMTGTLGEPIHRSNTGWQPVYVSESLAVISLQFLLEHSDDAVIWRGAKKNGMIKQFIRDVDWSDTNVLVFDTPPGTSDEHLSLVQFLKHAPGPTHVILVSTPQEVALQDVRKEISFCRKVHLNILGIVENMSTFVCPKCTQSSDIFPPTTGGVQALCQQLNIPYLGAMPLDPRIGMCGDQGRFFLHEFPESPAALAARSIVNNISDTLF
jgi:Mrp family chromosome partitioning ATPase